jgi:hypothetical protein
MIMRKKQDYAHQRKSKARSDHVAVVYPRWNHQIFFLQGDAGADAFRGCSSRYGRWISHNSKAVGGIHS